ncbi:MAG: hypothetical protein IPP45_10105, partial [Sphingomonadales bacterium]|nr:hypothetical protein [Sphingomonadales bacterium]
MAIHVEGTFFGCKYAITIVEGIQFGIDHQHGLGSLALGYSLIIAYTAAKGDPLDDQVDRNALPGEGIPDPLQRADAGAIETPMVQAVSGRAGRKNLFRRR